REDVTEDGIDQKTAVTEPIPHGGRPGSEAQSVPDGHVRVNGERRPYSANANSPGAGIRGFGSCYRRGRIWWIRYRHRGEEFRESSKSERVLDAERLLKARWKQMGRGKFIGPKEEKVLVNDLLDALVLDYQQNGRRSSDTLHGRLEPLRA